MPFDDSDCDCDYDDGMFGGETDSDVGDYEEDYREQYDDDIGEDYEEEYDTENDYYEEDEDEDENACRHFHRTVRRICLEAGITDYDCSKMGRDNKYVGELLNQALSKLESLGLEKDSSAAGEPFNQLKYVHNMMKSVSLKISFQMRSTERKMELLEKRRVCLAQQDSILRTLNGKLKSQGYPIFSDWQESQANCKILSKEVRGN